MKISIVGFNLFAAGGTTQSNLNLMNEFLDAGYEITYYNFTDFNQMDLINLLYTNRRFKTISFQPLTHLIENETAPSDYYYITRETFFPLAKFLRSKFPTSTIIGEIHAPLALLQTDLTPILPYFSYIRVGTESIKIEFMQRYEFKRVFTQTVSLHHIKPVDTVIKKTTKNLLIFSRFSEDQKDISYAIKLMDYLVNYLKQRDIHLYINGYGNGEILYKNLIGYYKIKNNVHINVPQPSDSVYLSTARFETLGYSIMEAISSGKQSLIYGGDDGVVKEIYQEFKTINWITKNLEQDGTVILTTLNQMPSQSKFNHDMTVVENMKKNYVEKFLRNKEEPVVLDEALIRPLTDEEIEDIMVLITNTTVQDDMRKYRLLYYSLKEWPVIGPLFKNEFIRYHAKNGLEKILNRKNKNDEKKEKIKKNYYFFESFHGKNFSGDPKHLALQLKKKKPDGVFFVSSINQLVDLEIRSYGFIPLRTGSKEYLEKFSECNYIVINGNSLDSAGKQKSQIIIETWHGLPLKKMVHDLENETERVKETQAFVPRMKKWDYLLTSSSYNTALLTSAFGLKKNRNLTILEQGAPRNTYLIENKNSKKEKERIYWKYFNRPYDSDKVFILFCPTWRKGDRKTISTIDLKQVISGLPDTYELIVKLHPLESKLRKKYAYLDDRIHCFFNELVDIQELYIISDVLISDFSSAIFDYAHLDRKIIVMQEDTTHYQNEVGWYFDIEKVYHLKANDYNSKSLVAKILTPESKDYNQLLTKNLLEQDSLESTKKIIKTIFKEEEL